MKGDWNTRLLGEVCKSYAGGTPNRSIQDYYSGQIPWISSSEVNKEYIDETNEYITELGLKFSSAKWIPKGAVLVAMYGATAGQVSKLKIDATSNQAVLALISIDIDKDFLFYILNFLKGNILYLAQGSGQPNLSKSLIDKTLITVPPLPQQKKIAKILSTCDQVIEKTEAAIAKYQDIKQGMMHDLFTRGIDLSTGKLRPTPEQAPGLYKDSELGKIPKDWEVKRLEEYLHLKSGEGITSERIENSGEYPVYGGNGLRGYTKDYTHDGNHVLIGRQGALCGNIVFASGIFFASEHAVVVSILNDSNPKWVEYKLFSMNLNQYSEASAQPGLSVQKIIRLTTKTPSGPEQNLISERIISLENKIDSENMVLAKYQNIKSGLMEDLLTGKVEVKVEQDEKAQI